MERGDVPPNQKFTISIPEQVDALGNQEDLKDSNIQIDSNCRTDDSNETDESFEVISESSSPESASYNITLLCSAKDMDDLKKLPITQSKSSSSTPDLTDTDESIQVISENCSLKESPIFHNFDSEVSVPRKLTNDTAKEASLYQIHEQQSPNDEHQKDNAEVRKTFVTETGTEVDFLEHEKMTVESYKSSDNNTGKSVRMKYEFVSGSSVATTEQTNVSEDLLQNSRGADISDAPQAVITDPSTIQENFSNSKPNCISNIEQLVVQVPTIYGKDMKKSGSPMRPEVKSGSIKSYEFFEQRTQQVEHQKVKLKESEIFKTEGNGKEKFLHQNGTEAKKDSSLECTHDKNIQLPIRNKFELVSSTIIVKHNKQKKTESNNQENKNVNIANKQQKLIADPTGDIAEVILQKLPGETVELASNTNLISDIKHHTIKKPIFDKKNLNSSGSSSITGTEVKSGSTESLDVSKRSKTSKEVPQETSLLTALINEFDMIQNSKKGNAPCPVECVEVKICESGSYYEMSNVRISENHLIHLLRRMSSNHYLANGNEFDLRIFGYCKYLFEKDYRIKVVTNERGTLCRNYPARIIVPYENRTPSKVPKILEEVTIKSSGATCRDRFIAPTIFWNGRLIYRSATLMVRESAAPESATIKEVEGDPGGSKRMLKHVRIASKPFFGATSETAEVTFGETGPEQIRERRRQRRNNQRELETHSSPRGQISLDHCHVLRITNLITDIGMKLWINLSSAEKIHQDSEEAEFYIEEIPFPDSEFFRRYHEHRRVPDGLLYESDRLDLVDITQNYLQTILSYFILRTKNIVIHCMSGWDQTPLFIALLRISLWADGLIHVSLNPHEMAFLTLGYDWYHFGHNLPARLKHGEEIMHYCYKFLEHLIEDNLSEEFIRRQALGSRAHGYYQRNCDRLRKITELKNIVLPLYDEHILKISR